MKTATPTAKAGGNFYGLGTYLGLAGALLFGGAWLTSLIAPQWVEQIGRELVRQEVERRVGEKLDVLDRSTLVGLARRLGGEQAQRAERAARQLRDQLPAKVAEQPAPARGVGLQGEVIVLPFNDMAMQSGYPTYNTVYPWESINNLNAHGSNLPA